MLELTPNHWHLLSKDDQQAYIFMHTEFQRDLAKSKKGERLDIFIDRVRRIHSFVERGDGDEWKRSLVCGVFFMRNALAVNIQQLRLLMNKCKSSINGSLLQLGYSVQPQMPPVTADLAASIPPSHRDIYELKKWTIRVRTPKDPFKIEASQRIPCPAKFRYKYYEYLAGRVQ